MDRDYTLDDFRTVLVNLQRMGGGDLIGHVPGLAEMVPGGEGPEAALKPVLWLEEGRVVAHEDGKTAASEIVARSLRVWTRKT